MSGKQKSETRRSAGRPRREDTSNRPEQILAAAVKLHACRGFEDVTTTDIAREAGVATSLVNHHFGGKRTFRAECNRYVLDQMHAILDDVINALENDLPFGDFVTKVGEISSQRVYIVRYLALLFLHEDDGASGFFREYFEKFHKITMGLKARGAIRDDIDPVWATLTRIFAQLGTAFLYRQVEDLIGSDPYSAEASTARFDTMSKIFRSGAFKPSDPGPKDA